MKKRYAILLLFFVLSTNLRAQTETWTVIDAGTDISTGIKEDGTLWSWGWDGYGQLGTNGGDVNVPTQVGTDNDWVSVSAGAYHSLALKQDGTLWSWGLNADGELGDGSTTQRNIPGQVGSDNNWAYISAGFAASYAIKTDGTLWSWGWNGFGQLGQGNTQALTTPTQVGTETDWAIVEIGGRHTLAMKTDGTIWGCGLNFSGQLGTGNTDSPQPSFILIGSESDWVEIAAGFGHSMGRKQDSTLWTWGFNANGQLGNGTTTQSTSPVQIGQGQSWTKIDAGATFIYAISADSSLYGSGFNGVGQLGNGTTANPEPTFQQLGSATDWVDIAGAAGLLFNNEIFGSHSIGLRADRVAICAAGNNFSGQLGDGSNDSDSLWTCDR
ncbi:MAG: chromosome condensation regulator RCC1, partial [Bacteroidota bacterium]